MTTPIPAQSLFSSGLADKTYSFDGNGAVSFENRVEVSSLPPSGWYETKKGVYVEHDDDHGATVTITWTSNVHQSWADVNPNDPEDNCVSGDGPVEERRGAEEERPLDDDDASETFRVDGDGKVQIPGFHHSEEMPSLTD